MNVDLSLQDLDDLIEVIDMIAVDYDFSGGDNLVLEKNMRRLRDLFQKTRAEILGRKIG